jgi:ribokinase
LAEGKTGNRNLLTVLGAVNWDISIFEERFPRQGEEVHVKAVEEFSGGKGANVAVAAARILGRDGVAFIGALGRDELSYRQVKELKAEGVIVEGLLRLPGARSGRAYILVDSGGRKTIHTHFGANEKLRPEHLKEWRVSKIIASTKMMIIMDPPTDVAESAARIAKKRGALVIYSPGVRSQEGLRSLEGVLEETDYLILDRVELKNLVRSENEKSMMEELLASYPKVNLIVTLSDRGCMLGRLDDIKSVGGVDLALLGKKTINTTGCGDAFLGVFASYVLLGTPVLEAIGWANLAGALKAARYETRGSPIREELEKSMNRLEKVRRSQLGLQANRAA